jgi:hypothetical protein
MSAAGQKKLNAVEAEIAGERAASLGRAGMRLRSAIGNLSAFDQRTASGDHRRASLITRRVELLDEAADALSAYVVQWEALGLYDAKAIASEYQVPPEIWNRMGAKRDIKTLS